MSEYPSFLGIDPPAELAQAAAAILPVPYDGTSTWKKGADRGPRAILEASQQVELYDIETGTEPWRHGFATLPPLHHDGDPETLAARVDESVGDLLDAGVLPVVLGGEHSVSIGAIRAAAARFGDLTVVQIDAHADTRESYEGSPFNHACVMARARELCPIVQVGIRSMDAGEVAALDPGRVFYAHDIVGSDPKWFGEVADLLTPNVYVTVDLDAFDPALLPATGTPEPGGLSWYEVVGLLDEIVARTRVVGFDVVELLPQPGFHGSEFVAAKLVHRTLAALLAKRND